MEMQSIQNENISVTISPIGAEPQSIRDKDGREYLWQGDPDYWKRRAINIFPYIGRLTDGRYQFEGHEYSLPIHGFLPGAAMEVESKTDTAVCFLLKDDEQTRAVYPFPFELRIRYALNGSTVEIQYDILNTGSGDMFFGIGGHPGFRVPLEDGLAFTDYALEFDRPCQPVRIGLSAKCFVNGEDEAYPLADGRTIPLSHDLFDHDAIVLKDMSPAVSLKSTKGSKGVSIHYPGMPYIGFWHSVKKDAPFVCVEPWSSLPSRDGVVEDISRQENLIRLPAGQRYLNDWSISLIQ